MNVNRIFLILFGIFLTAVAVYVWIQPVWNLSARSGGVIKFGRFAQFLFGLAPLLGGLAMFRAATVLEIKNERIATILFIAGVFSMIFSLLLTLKN